MSKLIRCFPLGSCGGHIAHTPLIRKGFLSDPFARLGFRRRPFALSSGAAVQLSEFCMGERIPARAIRLAYMETHQPTTQTRGVLDETEIVLVEMSTPIEFIIEGAIANFNRVNSCIVGPLRKSAIEPQLVYQWANALRNVREDLEERRNDLLMNWPNDVGDDGLARFGVEGLSSRRLGVAEMVRDLGLLREKFRTPIALQLYNFRYMPDGRMIDWPVGFKIQQTEVARCMDIPTLDFAPLVALIGTQRLIAPDMKHWRSDTVPLQAELTYDFLARILGRPSLKTYPESLAIGRDARATFPEFARVLDC